jgi:putative spermidine/putrescine transport system substrate-binding protein
MTSRLGVLLAFSLLFIAACGPSGNAIPRVTPESLAETKWEKIVEAARDTEVRFAMWAGDETRNRYFKGPVTEELQERYAIRLRVVPFSDTADAVNKLINERNQGLRTGSIDIVWINGENFRLARQGRALWGPFADSLPNILVYPDGARTRDFGTSVNGFEAPWQRSQFVFAYDSVRVPEPPRTLEALGDWARKHPGRFTYIAPPDFTGSAFIRHALLRFGDSPAAFHTFDEGHYRRASAKAIEWLRALRPHLWRKGESYPTTGRELDRLFANGEVDFAMSYSPSFASVRIERGEFPRSTRTFVFDHGTIGNYNYLAIPFNAPNPAAALVAINHLMSFEALVGLSETLQSPFPLELSRLTEEQRKRVAQLKRGPATLTDDELARRFMAEPDAEYLTRFEKDWQEKVLRP